MNEFFLLACEDNTHVNGLLSISAPADIVGWDTTCTSGTIYSNSISTCPNWHTFASGTPSCYIKTTLNGNGRAKIDFGNCYSNGVAKLFLDGKEIASAGASEPNIVKEFDFTDGSELMLTDESYGVISFNSFEDLNCKPSNPSKCLYNNSREETIHGNTVAYSSIAFDF